DSVTIDKIYRRVFEGSGQQIRVDSQPRFNGRRLSRCDSGIQQIVGLPRSLSQWFIMQQSYPAKYGIADSVEPDVHTKQHSHFTKRVTNQYPGVGEPKRVPDVSTEKDSATRT